MVDWKRKNTVRTGFRSFKIFRLALERSLFKRDGSKFLKRPAPTTKKIKHIKQDLVRAFKEEESPDLPYPFLKALMDLSYSGHFKLALRMTDETWPVEKPGLEKFKNEFSQALQNSPYWKESFNN